MNKWDCSIHPFFHGGTSIMSTSLILSALLIYLSTFSLRMCMLYLIGNRNLTKEAVRKGN